MYFSDIIGHNRNIENLINFIKLNKAGHAYIFTGPEGVGKMKTALAFASALMCDDFQGDSCGKCKNCRLTFGSAHPDLKVADYSVDSDGKVKASISVDAVRELKTDIYLKPFYAKRKIYILDNADKLTTEAQNALLKVFEEPPEYATVILICHNISKILSTIISRAVLVKFSSLKPEELEIYFDKYYNDKENKPVHSRIANGRVSEMIKNIDDENSLVFRNSVIDNAIDLFLTPANTSINGLYSLFMKNKEKRKDIIEYLSLFVFDCALYKTGVTKEIVNADKIEEIRNICRELTVKEIQNIENILITLNKKVSENANYKLAVLDALIRIKEEIYG